MLRGLMLFGKFNLQVEHLNSFLLLRSEMVIATTAPQEFALFKSETGSEPLTRQKRWTYIASQYNDRQL